MATESDINKALLDDIYAIYSQAETEMLDKVAKRIAKGIKTEGWNEQMLKETQSLRKDIEKIIKSKVYEGQALISEDIISAYTKGKISATIDAGTKAKGTSSIDLSAIKSKKLKESIQTAFDFAKGMEGLPQDPDNMFKKVVYAQGAMEQKMIKQGAGAQVIGDTIYICKPYSKYIDDEFIMHEIGHKVTKKGSKTTDAGQKDAAIELAKKLGYKDVKSMSSWVSDYAMKNPTELYPEVLMMYYKSLKTGKPLKGHKKKIVEAAMEQMYNDPAKKKKIHKEVEKFAKGIHTTVLDEFDIPMNLKQLILDTNKLLNNATFQILRNADDAYRKIMANATTGLLAGTDTRIQASQKMLNEMAAKGITSFVDKAGRHWSLSAYAEMCARTVSAHAALQGHLDRQKEVGEDLVKVSNIGTTCPICQKWQGVVLSISGQSPKYLPLENAKLDGLFHPNCKHTIYMHIPELDGEGKSEPNKVDPESQTYKRNKLIERQRANERQIRYWKDRATLALTPEEKAKALQKVKYWQHRNLLHCHENDLRRQYAREKTYAGNANGPTGAPIGGSLKEYEDFYKDVLGANPKQAYNESKKLYGMKEVTFEKWLKDEIDSLDQLDLDKAQMKDSSNKAVTPTSLYKKYIGDSPMKDYAEVSPFEKGTKEFKSSYAKWLKQQIEEIGVSYKVKPKYVEVHEDIPEEDKKLSATQIFKKYNDGKAPTQAYKDLGGEEGTGMKYGKWVETQKKELIKNGITKVVPFENATVGKTAKVVSDAKATNEKAKKLTQEVELADFQLDLNLKATSAYKASQLVKKAYNEAVKANQSGDKEAFELAMKKYEMAKAKDLEMVKIKATKNMMQDELTFENEIESLWDAINNTNDSEVTKHIKDKIKIYEEQLNKIKAEAEEKDKITSIKSIEDGEKVLSKYKGLTSVSSDISIASMYIEKYLKGDDTDKTQALFDLDAEVAYYKNKLDLPHIKSLGDTNPLKKGYKASLEMLEEVYNLLQAKEGAEKNDEFTIPGVKPKSEIKNLAKVSHHDIEDKIFDFEISGIDTSEVVLVASLKSAIANLEEAKTAPAIQMYSLQVEALYKMLDNQTNKAKTQPEKNVVTVAPIAKFPNVEAWLIESMKGVAKNVIEGAEVDKDAAINQLKVFMKSQKSNILHQNEKSENDVEAYIAAEDALMGLFDKEIKLPKGCPSKKSIYMHEAFVAPEWLDIEITKEALSAPPTIISESSSVDSIVQYIKTQKAFLNDYADDETDSKIFSKKIAAAYNVLYTKLSNEGNKNEKPKAQAVSGSRRRDVVSLGREVRVNEGRLVKQRELYQEIDFNDLEHLANQVKGHDLFAAGLRRDILGRNAAGKNHHQGHDVKLKSGLTSEQKELGKAFQTVYDDYVNTQKCSKINRACLDYDNASPYWKNAIKDMDMAIASCELAESVQTHRFISDEVMKAMFGTLDAHEVELGSLVHSKAFMSATVQSHGLYANTCDNMLTILTDKGTHVLPTLNYEEGEFIYPRNGKLEVVEIIDHTKKGWKRGTFKDGDVTFKGREIVVRFIEEDKAKDYEMVTPDKINEMLGKSELVDHHTQESRDWIKSLTSKERHASDRYTGSAYTRMNDVYRRNDISDKTHVENAHNLTEALRRARTTQPVVLRRGCKESDLAHMLGFQGDFKQVKNNWDEINNGGYAAEDKGFLSTSPYSSGGFSKDVELRIYCPTGTRAAYVDSISTHKGEQETLLQSGSIYRVVKLEEVGGRTIAYLELLGTD